MKKTALLLLCGALFMGACQKIEQHEIPSKDNGLTGVTVNVDNFANQANKVFLLNEGSMGSNNSTLDFLRLPAGLYITDAFGKMNPSVRGGLGDVGNDVAVINNELWIVVNNSGLVEVISCDDETEVKAISVPTPRNIAYDANYAYVTSWAGAFSQYEGYDLVDYSNPKGQVYRINLKTKEVEGTVEVGYQPEGIACYNGNLYVANSGGLALPPTYSYDNTVSIIDAASFAVKKEVEVQINLKNVYSDGKGNIYVTTMGNYYDVHSGLYMFKAASPDSPVHIADNVSVSTINGDTVYCIGTETEFQWGADHSYSSFTVKNGVKTPLTLNLTHNTPYSIGVLNENTIFVGELALSSYEDEGETKWSSDYFNPGSVTCYWHGNKLWTVQAGVCPGHFAIY
ncbi:MAG: hypothetical protein II636_08165 [Bacteroidales bacterium]|nr:hypothetical protein [Bacteroidales bacterium]MBQ2104464.1 hypothetical protein [Bacteroidales bacterium]MBQ3976483.1 hypothetical protein [Bacteroidales bacterium]MBQ3985286.1 hypothetical protein [Bacteroidales bacterium]